VQRLVEALRSIARHVEAGSEAGSLQGRFPVCSACLKRCAKTSWALMLANETSFRSSERT
jgi:hypothetical protein